MTEKELMEENQKYMRNMYELAEQVCMNKRHSGICRECEHYNLEKCLHPEQSFPLVRRY